MADVLQTSTIMIIQTKLVDSLTDQIRILFYQRATNFVDEDEDDALILPMIQILDETVLKSLINNVRR